LFFSADRASPSFLARFAARFPAFFSRLRAFFASFFSFFVSFLAFFFAKLRSSPRVSSSRGRFLPEFPESLDDDGEES
jgi:hypothetical protein